MTDALAALAKLREPFPPHHISKLPKETGAQAKQRKQAQDAGNWPKKCNICGGFHHERAVHLDYVGHAALTDRLLDADPTWAWEPVAFGPNGLPAVDQNGGMWIKLTVCGVSRLGYGSADGKQGGDAVKEIIGDALRNAAMRFGAALDLWHKGDLHADETGEAEQQNKRQEGPPRITPEQELMLEDKMREAGVDFAKFLQKGAGVTKAADLPAEKFPGAMKVLNDMLAKANQQQRQNHHNNQSASADLDDEIPY